MKYWTLLAQIQKGFFETLSFIWKHRLSKNGQYLPGPLFVCTFKLLDSNFSDEPKLISFFHVAFSKLCKHSPYIYVFYWLSMVISFSGSLPRLDLSYLWDSCVLGWTVSPYYILNIHVFSPHIICHLFSLSYCSQKRSKRNEHHHILCNKCQMIE